MFISYVHTAHVYSLLSPCFNIYGLNFQTKIFQLMGLGFPTSYQILDKTRLPRKLFPFVYAPFTRLSILIPLISYPYLYFCDPVAYY